MEDLLQYEMFTVKCPKCGAEPGKACSRWEGAPAACAERSEAAKNEAKAGSTYHAPGCPCGFCKAGFTRF